MKVSRRQHIIVAAVLACALAAATAQAQNQSGLDRPVTLAPADATSSGGSGAENDKQALADKLATQLANPVAALISLPLQNNFDFGFGANNGWRYTLNVQPVIPISLSKDWNLISRTVVPIIHQENVIGSSTQSGLSDTVQSLFFSPKEPTSGGWIWGVGPALLIPTATDNLLGGEKWGAGPTALALKQAGPWTYGALVNQLWSFAGNGRRDDISASLLQPFTTYQLGNGRSVTFQTENTYDWKNSQWTVPLVLAYSKVTKIGPQMVSFTAGAKYFAEKPDDGPDWGLRFAVVFLFPK